MQGTKYHENTTLTFFTLLVLPKQCIICLLVNQKLENSLLILRIDKQVNTQPISKFLQIFEFSRQKFFTFFTLLVLPKQCIICHQINQNFKFHLNVNSYNHASFFFKYLNFPAKNTILTLFLPKHSIICHLINHNLFICQKFEYLVKISRKD